MRKKTEKDELCKEWYNIIVKYRVANKCDKTTITPCVSQHFWKVSFGLCSGRGAVLRLLHAREASKSSVAVHVCERRCLLCIATSVTPTIDALYTLNVVGAALDLHPRVLDKHREREREEAHTRYEEWRMGCRQQPAYSYPLNTHKQIKTLSLSHTHTCAHTHTHAHAQEAHARTHAHTHTLPCMLYRCVYWPDLWWAACSGHKQVWRVWSQCTTRGYGEFTGGARASQRACMYAGSSEVLTR